MSFSTAINSVIITADLTLAAMDGSGTQTVSICSANIENFETTTFSEHYPILKTVKRLTQEHDQFMPLNSSASLTLDNSEQSLGFQRRFFDLLDTHTITEQDCAITINLKSSEGTTAKFSETFTYKMQGAEHDPENQELTIDLKNSPIREKIITKEITTTDFPSVYTSSIGRFLPLVFGENANVLCEKLGAAEYGFATNFGGDYSCSDPIQYYIKSLDGQYRGINFAASTSTQILNNPTGATATSAVIFGDEELGNKQGWGWELQDFADNETGYLIDRGVFKMIGKSGLSIVGSGDWVFQIAVGNFPTVGATEFIPDYKILGSAVVSKLDYETEMNIAVVYDVDFTFDEPVVIGKDQNETLKYYLLVTDTDSRNISFSYYRDYDLDAGNVDRLRFSEYYGGWEYESLATTSAEFFFYGATVVDSSSTAIDSNGLAYHSFTIDTGTNTNNLSKYDFGVVVDGLGTTSSPDTDAPTIIKNLLDQTSNDYVDAGFDSDWAESQTAYPRSISGALVGRTQLTTALRELCKNGACRILNVAGFSSAVGVDVQSWGAVVSSTHDLYDTDFKTTAVTISNRESVINNITASYDRNPITTDSEEFLRQGVSSGFTASLSNYSISANSISIYGENDLSDGSFQLIKDVTSMQSVAEFFLRSFDNPPTYTDIVFPYIPRSFIAGRVIEVTTPQLPAYYGTSTKPLPAIDSNGQVVEVEDGIDQVRAIRYRALIEGRRIVMNKKGQVLINLRVKLLKSSYDPT